MNSNVPKSDLSNCKAGDWIWTIFSGWCTVLTANYNETYPVATSICEFTWDGLYEEDNLYPSAWTYNPFDPNDKPPCEFKEGEVVMVSNNAVIWDSVEFSNSDGKRFFDNRAHPWKFCRKLNSTERGG